MVDSNSKRQQMPSEPTQVPEQSPTLLNVKTPELTADKGDTAESGECMYVALADQSDVEVTPAARAVIDEQVATASWLVVIELIMIPVLFLYGCFVIPGHHGITTIAGSFPVAIEACTVLLSMKWQQGIYSEVKAWSVRDDVHPKARIAFERMESPLEVCGLKCPITIVTANSLMSITTFWASIGTAQVAGQSFGLWNEEVQKNWVLYWGNVGGIAAYVTIPVMLTFFAAISYAVLLTFVPVWFRRVKDRNTPEDDQCANFKFWLGWGWFRAAAEAAHLALVTEMCSQLQQVAAEESDKRMVDKGWKAANDRLGCNLRLCFIGGPNLVLKCGLLHLVKTSNPIAMLVPIAMSFYSKGVFIPKLVRDVTTRDDDYQKLFCTFLFGMVLWYALAVYIAIQATWGLLVVIIVFAMTLMGPCFAEGSS